MYVAQEYRVFWKLCKLALEYLHPLFLFPHPAYAIHKTAPPEYKSSD